jgi:hypothetical protein
MNQGGYDANDNLGSSGQQRTTVRGDDGILPVTIKQLHNSTFEESTNEIKIDGISRKQVAVVGMTTGHKEENLDVEYIINDTTGNFKVKVFINEGDQEIIQDGTWVYVCGRISLSTRDMITAFTIREIKDFNQIAFHMLSACFVHLQTKHGAAPGSLFTTHVAKQELSTTQAAVQQVAKMSEEERAERIKEAVVKFLKSVNSDTGASTQQIIEALSNEFSTDDINNAIQSASFNGEIYATNEEGHYAPC